MDSGADATQKMVIGGAIILALIIVLVIGYSLYTKAKRAEGELANKVALDQQTKQTGTNANISLTGEAQKSPSFNYDGLIQKGQNNSTTSNFEIVNETATVTVPEETVPVEETEAITEPDVQPTTPKKPAYKYVDNSDRPLTLEEIYRIRQLPVDNSPSGNLQTALEAESNGQYKARY